MLALRIPRYRASIGALMVALLLAQSSSLGWAQTGNPGQPGSPTNPGSPTGGPGGPPTTPGTQDVAPRAVSLPPSVAERARGMVIVSIEVAGSRRVAKDDILTYLHERVGQPFTPESLTTDVRELWKSGFFDDIEVDLTRKGQGVVLRFLVRERPSIKSIEFKGNSEIENDKLTEALEIKPGSTLSYPALRRAVQKIRDMYAEKGYFLAEAQFEVVPQRNNEVIVKFTIKEHEQVSVRRITIIGADRIPESDLRDVMITGQGGFFAFGSGGPFRQDAFDRDIYMISSMYYDRGFLKVEISAPRVMLTPDRNGIELTIVINEGPQYKIRSLRIFEIDKNGKEVEPIDGRRHLREMIKAKNGEYFNSSQLRKDLQSVRTMYRDHGYANWEGEPQTQVDHETHEVDVVIPMRRNNLVHFNRIEIHGNNKTRDKVIRRELEISEGELFSETKLERSKLRVLRLGYFERVDFSTESTQGSDSVNVNFEVTERPTGTFQVGAGFSSIENFIATAQVQQQNLFGTGQSLSIQGQVSGIRQLININWFEPYMFDTRFFSSVSLYDQLRVYNDFAQTSRGGSLTIGYPIIQPKLTASLTYTLQNDIVATGNTSTFLGTASAVSVFRRLPLANLFNDGLTSSVRPTITFDTRNNQLFPSKGIYLRGSVELASSAIGAENEFLRYYGIARFYYPIADGFVLKLNSNAGLVTSPNPAGVPIFARFFLGGILDVRGFNLRTIGPRLPLNSSLDPNSAPITNGANIGGNLMYYQNLEFEFPIVEKVGIRGVVFTDAGNTWNLESLYCDAAGGGTINGVKGAFGGKTNTVTDPCFSFPNSIGRLRTSYGFGLRWFSPLGPLRFEWGYPFSPLQYEDSSNFQFTIGNFF
jgi:outer membrane protein insertion porin family